MARLNLKDRTVLRLVPADATWRAVVATKAGRDYYVELPLACWALVESTNVETEEKFQELVGMVADPLVSLADELDGFLGYKHRDDRRRKWREVAEKEAPDILKAYPLPEPEDEESEEDK